MESIAAIARDPLLDRLLRHLEKPPKTTGDDTRSARAANPPYAQVFGLWGSSTALVVAMAAQRTARTMLVITAHAEEADAMRDDIEMFLDRPCEIFPAWEGLPGEGAGSVEIQAERMQVCNRLRQAGTPGPVLIAPIQALMQPVPSTRALDAARLDVKQGDTCTRDVLQQWLAGRGFERLDRVEAPGDYAVRGDIVDVFSPGGRLPIRLELLDDRIESIRTFDLSTHRSVEQLAHVSLLASRTESAIDPDDNTILAAHLPAETIVLIDEPAQVQSFGDAVQRRLDDARIGDIEQVLADLSRFTNVHVNRLPGASAGDDDSIYAFDVHSLARFEGAANQVIGDLCKAAADKDVIVFCDTDAERDRLYELIAEHVNRIPPTLTTQHGFLHRGFEWRSADTICVGNHELFGRYQQRRKLRRVRASRPLESYLELEPGDLVVHVVHGLARFRQIKSLPKGNDGDLEEYLTLEFAERAELHVPVSQIDLVQKYIGAGASKPRLSTLGGTRWKKLKERVYDAISDFAEGLLRVQAARQAQEGIAYPADTLWQREFEGSFIYEETPDQVMIAAEIKDDLQRRRPMDRLVCGDVGFGKTELAIRAAFKVVEYGRQVAVLVPTTVLAEQHYQTFRERMADYPFDIRCLSRFRTTKEQRAIIEDARKGRVDVLIGTHRLLSKDVDFKTLGLVVIDEEQRFGVEHKDRLKQLRHTVDVLTLTATPIPRTLHMSMLGIRDISALQTPPMDRRAIATQIRSFDEQLIREAVIREINRDGQVFFVHNIVKTIHAMAGEIARIVPDARIMVGHGQMAEGELERVMTAFVHHEADVLVSTTIIESGIDISRANTIFINLADRFGLADLHQLRGRVGRSHHRAYCYLLLPKNRPITPKAARRLKSIEEFSELGAGFRIAMRDLEIRGAGNILGPEQSGHIEAVGYEMYCQMIERAVRRLKGEESDETPRVQLDLQMTGNIPRSYIASDRARIDAYKRIASCRRLEELFQIERDLVDAYGALPPELATLLELAEVRILAGQATVRSISIQGPDVVFVADAPRAVEMLLADAVGSKRVIDSRTMHWRPPASYLEGPSLLAVLRRRLASSEPSHAK